MMGNKREESTRTAQTSAKVNSVHADPDDFKNLPRDFLLQIYISDKFSWEPVRFNTDMHQIVEKLWYTETQGHIKWRRTNVK